MQAVHFLLVRKAQLLREIKALGPLYSIVVAGAVALFLTFFFKYQVTAQKVALSGLVIALFVAGIHFLRKDHRFLNLVSPDPFLIYLTEYAAFVLPFVILSWIGFGQPLFFLILVPLVVISFIKVKLKPSVNLSFTDRLIADTNFEWKAGMRKTGWMLVLIWLVALALTAVPFASLVALWFFLLILSSFYDEGEPREMLESYQLETVKFIKKKLTIQLVSYLKPVLPVLLISFLFFPDRWWIFLLFLVFGAVNVVNFVLAKYAVWRSAEINHSSSIVNTMCLLGLFLPFLLPLPLIVIIKNYRKSVINLKPVLHDYHK